MTRFFTILGLISLAGILFFSSSAGAFDITAHGYFRNQTEYYHDLDTQKVNPNVSQGGTGDNDRFGAIAFNQQRFRLEPMVKLNDNVSAHLQMDFLDNIIAGTSEIDQVDFQSPIVGTVQMPGAGGAFGVVGGESGENKTFNFRRAWVAVLTPMGQFRLGRQPSHWGLGIIANDGNDWDANFGDTFDRLMYVASMDFGDAGFFAFGTVLDFVFSTQEDPIVSGLGGAIRVPKEDMRQVAQIFIYERPEFTLGLFGGLRFRDGTEGRAVTTARGILLDANGNPVLDSSGNFQLGDPVAAGIDGNTLLYFFDVYTRLEVGIFKTQLEYAFMGGDISTGLAIDQVPFNNLPANARGPFELPSESLLQVHLAAMETDFTFHPYGEIKLIGGFASGDEQPLSSKITQFGFRQDYHIGLLMFQVPVGTSPRLTQANGDGNGARQLTGGVPVTGNFVNNAIYTGLTYKLPLPLHFIIPKSRDGKLGVHVLTAWAHKDTFNINFAEVSGFDDLPHVINTNRWYGLEVDASFEARFFTHVYTNVTFGWLLPGTAYDVEVVPFEPANLAQVNAIPFDAADPVIGLRGSLVVDF